MIKISIGATIKKLRKSKNITQEGLAKLSGISKNALWNYENEHRQPNIEILNNIATALNIEINDIISTSLKELSVSELFGARIVNKEKLIESNSLEESIMNSKETDTLMTSLITKAKINEKLKTIEEIKNFIINESENVLDDLRSLSNELDNQRLSIMFEINKLENK